MSGLVPGCEASDFEGRFVRSRISNAQSGIIPLISKTAPIVNKTSPYIKLLSMYKIHLLILCHLPLFNTTFYS